MSITCLNLIQKVKARFELVYKQEKYAARATARATAALLFEGSHHFVDSHLQQIHNGGICQPYRFDGIAILAEQ